MARRERNIYKRADGRYEGRYIKKYDSDGKAKYGAVYARTYAEVRERLRQTKSCGSLAREGRSHRVKDIMENYLESAKIRIKPSTYGIYERYITNHISPYFGNAKNNRLTRETLQGFVDQMLKNGLSVVTAQSIFSFLKTGLNGARNPDFDVKLPKRQNVRPEIFSLDEQRRVEAAAKEYADNSYVGIILCFYTGIRIGELCGLMWSDIDFECKLLHVRRTLQRIKNTDVGAQGGPKSKLVFMPPKSVSSARSIPLPEFLIAILLKHKRQSDGRYVISRNGKPVEPRNYQYHFKKLLALANVKRLNYHATRHTFATRALENGFDVKTLSEILGHASATVTLDKYAHSLDEHKRSRMEALAALQR